MALQDLTPQLRTRLSRVERIVGVFVILAAMLMMAGFIYYIYATAQRKGWFVTKVTYHTFVDSATGFLVGNPVRLMGFTAGEITKILPEPPETYYRNVYIEFVVREPYFGYLWTDSRVRVASADFLGNRFLEVTKGGASGKKVQATYRYNTSGELEMWVDPDPENNIAGNVFQPVSELKSGTNEFKGYWLIADESPPLTERLQTMVTNFSQALPAVFALTNSINNTLSNSSRTLVRLEQILQNLQPAVTNAVVITDHLTNPNGSLGQWLIPTQINTRIETTLDSAHSTVRTAETNLQALSSNLNRSLDNIAGITHNLRQQVEANSLLLTELSQLLIDADDFVQGLKRNWLLKSAFAPATNAPIESLLEPAAGRP